MTSENVAEDEAGELAVAVSAKVVDNQLIDESRTLPSPDVSSPNRVKARTCESTIPDQ
ncbi:hypothetical protein [Actinacidiphila yeochonensis]|uniref:hypothetical protein n=1 Tax=Actinacidiphila yeochonensis TaxID=89050 RepID=UPI000A960133|nr:hypothetical protein [Actinacidiphila yeochonensis]